jgi:hypothetical protein
MDAPWGTDHNNNKVHFNPKVIELSAKLEYIL